MKKQIDLTRPSERRTLTHQPIPVVPVKKETPEAVVPPTPPEPAPTPSNSFSLITILLLAIIVIMLGFIYYIFFLSA